MIQSTKLKWNLFALVAGLTAFIALPRLQGLPNVLENLTELYDGFFTVVYLQPVAALLSVIGLGIAVFGAVRRDLPVAAIGFFIGSVYVVYLLLSWLAWGLSFSSWTFLPLVGMFDYDFTEFDLWTWISYFHYNFVLFLVGAMGFILFKLWSELRTQAATDDSPSPEGSTAVTTQTNFCSTCGEKTVPGGSFCPKCGASLSHGAPISTAKYNTLAIVAFIISWFIPIVGFFLAYAGRREIQASGGTQKGDGFVLGALVLNWVWVGSLVLIVLLLAVAG